MTAAPERLELLPLRHGFAAVLVLKVRCPLNGYPCGCSAQQLDICTEDAAGMGAAAEPAKPTRRKATR